LQNNSEQQRDSDILFISDLHLSAQRPATVSLFLKFLEQVAGNAARLYILGDLFDVWLGDDDRTEPIPQIQTALANLTARSTRLFLMHGNRDFLMGEQFCRDTGCELLPDPTLIDLGGTPTLLMHGDLLCSDDLAYQQARGQLRDPAFISEFLSKPLPERAGLAAEYRKQSGEATSLLPEQIMDVNMQTVAATMRRHKVRQLIHGHTHRPATHEFTLDGDPARRMVLAEWHEQRGQYLRADSSGIESCGFPAE
jgi:UDP-2,3-diacylglucosamine hydrolase